MEEIIMNMQKLIKIIISVFFIPLILAMIYTTITFVTEDLATCLVSLLITIGAIALYRKLMIHTYNIKKIDVKEYLEKYKKEHEEKKQRIETEKALANEYEKISDNFSINQNKRILLINNKEYSFSEIVNARLVEDWIEQTTISGVRNSYIAYRMILRTGTTEKLVTQMDIEIKTNQLNEPVINAKFLKLGIKIGYRKKSKKYKKAYAQAQKCLSILEIIIRENNN